MLTKTWPFFSRAILEWKLSVKSKQKTWAIKRKSSAVYISELVSQNFEYTRSSDYLSLWLCSAEICDTRFCNQAGSHAERKFFMALTWESFDSARMVVQNFIINRWGQPSDTRWGAKLNRPTRNIFCFEDLDTEIWIKTAKLIIRLLSVSWIEIYLNRGW